MVLSAPSLRFEVKVFVCWCVCMSVMSVCVRSGVHERERERKKRRTPMLAYKMFVSFKRRQDKGFLKHITGWVTYWIQTVLERYSAFYRYKS